MSVSPDQYFLVFLLMLYILEPKVLCVWLVKNLDDLGLLCKWRPICLPFEDWYHYFLLKFKEMNLCLKS